MAASGTASHADIRLEPCQTQIANFTPKPIREHTLVPLTPNTHQPPPSPPLPPPKKTPPLFLREGVWEVSAWERWRTHLQRCHRGLYTLCLLNTLKDDSSVVPPTGWAWVLHNLVIKTACCVGNSTASEKLRAAHTRIHTQWCMWIYSTLQWYHYTV